MANVRSLTTEALFKALQINIEWQQKWSRELEQIEYFGKPAPAQFISYGKQLICEHQERIEAIEMELDRRQRIEIFKEFYNEICKQT